MAISKIASAGITADFSNTLTAADLAPDSVDSSELVDGSIDTAHIGDDQVTADKLANSINTDIATGVAALPKSGGTMSGAVTGMTNLIVSSAGTTSPPWLAQFSNTGGGADDNGVLIKGGSTTNEYSLNVANESGTSLLAVKGNGNVGIGTTSPAELLHIKNPSGEWNQYATIRIGTETNDSHACEIGFHRGTSNDNDKGFFISGDGTNKHVRVLHNGNVGIGTTAPSSHALLQITGGPYAFCAFECTNSGGRQYEWFSYTDGKFHLYDRTADAYRMSVSSNGDIILSQLMLSIEM